MVDFEHAQYPRRHASSDPTYNYDTKGARQISLDEEDLTIMMEKVKSTESAASDTHDAAPLLAQPPSLGCISESECDGPFSDHEIDTEHRMKRIHRIERNSAYVASRRPFRTRCALKSKKLFTRFLYFLIGLVMGVFYLLGLVMEKVVGVVMMLSNSSGIDDEDCDYDDMNNRRRTLHESGEAASVYLGNPRAKFI